MVYSICPLVDIMVKGDNIYFVSDDIFTLDKCSPEIIKAIKGLKKGITYEDLINILNANTANDLIDALNEMGMLRVNYKNEYKNNIVENQVEYFNCLSSDPNKIQNTISSKTVCILGVGGIGSIVYQHLIASGVKSFILIDGDKVEINNFNRQFIYDKNQIGIEKTLCAMEYGQARDPKISIKTFNKFISSSNDLNFLDKYKIDFFLCAADKPVKEIQRIVSEYCFKRDIAFSSASVGINVGTWGPLIIPSKTICLKCFCEKEIEDISDIEKEIIESKEFDTLKASFSVTNTVISAFVAKDIIFYLADNYMDTLATRFEFNFNTMETRKVNLGDVRCSCYKKEVLKK